MSPSDPSPAPALTSPPLPLVSPRLVSTNERPVWDNWCIQLTRLHYWPVQTGHSSGLEMQLSPGLGLWVGLSWEPRAVSRITWLLTSAALRQLVRPLLRSTVLKTVGHQLLNLPNYISLSISVGADCWLLTKTQDCNNEESSWKYKTLIKILISDLGPDWSFMNLNYLNIKLGNTKYSQKWIIQNDFW